MDSLKGATLIKADGSKVQAEAALENKVRPSLSFLRSGVETQS